MGSKQEEANADAPPLEDGVPGLLRVKFGKTNVVKLTLLRTPTMEDFDEYVEWYLGMYDQFAEDRCKFSVVFDLRAPAGVPGVDMMLLKFMLTKALEPRTNVQMSCAAILMKPPKGDAWSIVVKVIQEYLCARTESPVPRKLFTDVDALKAFVAEHHVHGAAATIPSNVLEEAVSVSAPKVNDLVGKAVEEGAWHGQGGNDLDEQMDK